MVCSSTLRAKPVTHSTKRCWPRWVKPTAIGNRMACQSDHSGVAFIAHLLEGWFVGGHNRQAPSRRWACQSTRMQDNGERHCQTLDFTRNYCLGCSSRLLPGPFRDSTLVLTSCCCTLWQGLSRDASLSRVGQPLPLRAAPLATLLLAEPTTPGRPLLPAPQAQGSPQAHAPDHPAGDPPVGGEVRAE